MPSRSNHPLSMVQTVPVTVEVLEDTTGVSCTFLVTHIVGYILTGIFPTFERDS
eukprot:COSAG05_NODE_881_length_6789_cov_21.387743_9_plen_54_part_00